MADFVYDGQALVDLGVLFLTMAPNTVGTTVTSTTYVWYGKVSVTLRTSRGQGVVTAFELLSDVNGDEMSYNFVGTDLHTAQTNFRAQAAPDEGKLLYLLVWN